MAESHATPIVINNWIAGIADSPHQGFADIRNADIYTISGIMRTGRKAGKVSSTTVTGLVKWIVKNPGGNYYAVSDDGKVYKSTNANGTWSVISGNTTTSASANGLAVWKDYLVVARDAALDVMKISDETWSNSWQTLESDSEWHSMWVGQDDILYIGNGRYIASVQELTDFVPGTSSTYTWTAQALDLPEGYRVKCLTELGKWLMIGTIRGTQALYGGEKSADIFPWDRVSPSFELPIRINDFGVHALLTIGNVVYAITGFPGNIYRTNGSAFQFVRCLPYQVVTGSAELSTSGVQVNIYPGAIAHHDNRIFFGVSSTSVSSGVHDGLGVWSMKEDGTMLFAHSISTGTMDADGTSTQISALYSVGTQQLLIAWKDDTTYGLDYVTDTRYASYETYAISGLIPVGTSLQKRTFSEIEFYLTRDLAADQAVRLSYRKKLSDSFTTIGTFDYATCGAVTSYTAPALIEKADFVQIKIELDGTTSTTPELLKVVLR